jgi:uncharacterized membrane protein YesL
MDVFKALFYQYKGGRGVTAPPPAKGIKRLAFLCYTHFWRLIGLNLLFILFCLPVVTIPPTITALNKVLLNLVREGNAFFIKDFIDEFKSSFIKSWIAFLPCLVLIGIAVFGYSLISDVYTGLPYIVVFVMAFSIVYCQSGYCFTMIALVDLPIGKIIKNSFIMVLVEMKRNILMIITVPIFILCAIYYIYSIPITLLFAFSFVGIINVMIANEAIEERVIQPNINTGSPASREA